MQAKTEWIPMKKQIAVSVSDLRYICIECPTCHTKVTLDMKQPSDFSQTHDYFAPTICPGCHQSYDSTLVNNVNALQRMYKNLAGFASMLTFQGDVEIDE